MLLLQNVINTMENETAIELELGIEGFSSFTEFLENTFDGIQKLKNKLLNENFPVIEVMPLEINKIEKLLKNKNMDLMDLEKLAIYRTEGLTIPNADFVKLLSEQGDDMYGIVTRLYRPMNKWLANALSHEDFVDKLWNDRDLEMVDLDKYKKALANAFKRRRVNEDDPDMIALGSLYGSMKQFVSTETMLRQVADQGKDFDLALLEKAEKDLAGYIRDITADDMPEIPKMTKQKIVTVLKSIVAETEYFVAYNFMLTTTITAWNDSIHKIETKLLES